METHGKLAGICKLKLTLSLFTFLKICIGLKNGGLSYCMLKWIEVNWVLQVQDNNRLKTLHERSVLWFVFTKVQKS